MWLAGRQCTLWPSAVLDLWNSNFLTVGVVKSQFCISVPNFVKIGQTVAEIWWFLWWRPPPSWIFKNWNFNRRSPVRAECASPCQISSKSVKRLQRYGNLTVFKMAVVRHLGFVKFKFFNGRIKVKRPILHQHTKFRRDPSNCCGDIAIFVIFQDGGRRHLGFSKIQNFNSWSSASCNMRHRAKFHQDRSKGCR